MPEPVTLAEIKDYARIDFADDDALITSLGIAAREYIETATGRVFTTGPVPDKAKLAIKALASTWYDNRASFVHGSSAPVPMHIKSIISQLRGGVLEPSEATA